MSSHPFGTFLFLPLTLPSPLLTLVYIGTEVRTTKKFDMQRSTLPSQLSKRRKIDVADSSADVNKVFVVPDSRRAGGLVPLGLTPRVSQRPLHTPIGPDAFILYDPPDPNPHDLVHVVVDPRLAKVLRDYQKDGVRFLWECVSGIRNPDNFGAIMADEMGMGKTLQVITVLWTLLRQSPRASPEITNAVIIAPASLIGNWDSEITKWLGKDTVRTMTVGTGTRQQVYQQLSSFVTAPVVSGRSHTPILIITYESFRSHADVLSTGEIGLVICDEGHRLKNQDNLTYKALVRINCKKRIIITGTPIQNDLSEYFSLVNFVSEGLLGESKDFRKKYEGPILKSKETNASDVEKGAGHVAMQFLMDVVEKCMIRRTGKINNKYLPQKIEFLVCVEMTTKQRVLYEEIMEEANRVKRSRMMALNRLKKVVNHPALLDGFPKGVQPEDSGKLGLVSRLIAEVRGSSDDKFVIISNFTETLDLLAKYFRTQNYGTLRLDGGMSATARTKVVDKFNGNSSSPEFILLLSSKAGGCGLNLIGGNRLVMFDPDWNPANDSQAMARIWRQGQKKTCYVYRLVATGTLEERIIQRQTSKKSLSSSLIDHDEAEAIKMFDPAEMKRLFEFIPTKNSIIHDVMECKRCEGEMEVQKPSDTADIYSDISDWHHSFRGKGLPDSALRRASEPSVSFVFYQYSHFPESRESIP